MRSFCTRAAYRTALEFLITDTQRTYPNWRKIDRIHAKLPKIWLRMKRQEGYV
jgi:hypothetical protein